MNLMKTGERNHTEICSICGRSFECGAFDKECWCNDLPKVPQELIDGSTCLCRDCLQNRIDEPGKMRNEIHTE